MSEVAEVVRLVDEICKLDGKDVELKKIEEQARALRTQRAQAAQSLRVILDRMDLTNPGNYGHEQRIAMFLVELRRVVQAEKNVVEAKGVAALYANDALDLEISKLKKELSEAQSAVIAHAADAERKRKEVEELTTKLLEAKTTLDSLMRDLGEMRAAWNDSDQRAAAYQRERDELASRLDNLAERFVKLEGENDERCRQLAAVRTDRDNVWVWLGSTSENSPSSLSCPVVMTADTLREMLGDSIKMKTAAMRLERSILNDEPSVPSLAITLMKLVLGRPL